MQLSSVLIPDKQSGIYFLPDMILHYLIDSQSRKVVLPEKQTFRSLLAYIDIPQFSKIEANYISKSVEGYEQVAKFFSRYLDAFQLTIGRTGAEILKFANHKLIVVWPTSNNRTEDEISLCCKIALKAAFDFRQAVADMTSIEGFQAMLNICFGFGDVSLLHMGGIENKIEYLVVGIAFLEALDCENTITDNDCTIISNSVYDRVKDMFDCEDVAKFSSKEGKSSLLKSARFFKVTTYNGGRLPTPKSNPLIFKSKLSPTLIEELRPKIANYVQKEYLSFVQESIENWGCEYRRATVVHINLSIDPSSLATESPVGKLNQFVRKIQAITNYHQGMIYRTALDQKGFTVSLIFGLYPQAQQETSVAAVMCSLATFTEIGNYLPGMVSCGVSTGDIYLGFVGQEQRAIFGSSEAIFLSNLLMHAACKEKEIKILIDEATAKEAARKINFIPYLRNSFQGRLAQEQIFSLEVKDGNEGCMADPLSELRTHLQNSNIGRNYSMIKVTQMIGKQELLQRNKEIILDFLANPSSCGLSLIAGSMGSGKTLFARNLYDALKQAFDQKQGSWKDRESSLILCSGIEAQSQNLKLNGWRKILKDLIYRLSKEYRLTSEETLKKVLAQQQDLVASVTVLNNVLGLNHQTSITQIIQPSKEDLLIKNKELNSYEEKTITEIAFEILKYYLEVTQSSSGIDNRLFLQYKTGGSGAIPTMRPPLVLFLDDLQDYDELSWNLLVKVAKKLKRVYIVGLFRVDELEFLASKKAQLLQQGIIDLTTDQQNLAKIVIDPLTHKEVAQLIAFTLGGSECDSGTADVILQRTKGNPLLIIQLLTCLGKEIIIQAGNVTLSERMRRILLYGENFIDMPVPNLCHKLYTPNLDQLPLEQYLLLKLASSFGEKFDLKTLIVVNPFKANLLTHSKIVNALEAIKETGLITIHEQKEDKNIVYKFEFPFLNELLFQKLPYSLKKNLKKQISETANFTDQSEAKSASRIEESGKSLSHWKLEERGRNLQDSREEVVESVRTKLSELSGEKDFVLKAEILEKKAIRTPRKWIPRYFALCQRTIKWYLNEEHMIKDPDAPIGVILLEHIYKIRVSKQEDPQKPYGIVLDVGNWSKKNQVYYGRSLFLACKDVNQAENWYIWVEATRTKVILEEFWSNFEDKTKVFNQLSRKPLSNSGKNPFDQTTNGLYNPKIFKNAISPDRFESTASSYKGRDVFSSSGARHYSTDPKSVVEPFVAEDDPADLERDRASTAEFGIQAQISAQPEKNALIQEMQASNINRLTFDATERSKVNSSSKNISPASQMMEVTTTSRIRQASPEAEKHANSNKEIFPNYYSQRRQERVKSSQRLLLEEFLHKSQATFWSHILTAASKPHLARIYHLNGSDESPRAKDASPKGEFKKVEGNSNVDSSGPVSILRKRSSSRDRENITTRKRSISHDAETSTARKRSLSRDAEEQVERIHRLPNRVYQSDWEVPQSRRSIVFNDDVISNLAGTAHNSKFFDKSEADNSAYQDLQNMSFTDQSNMSFTKEFGEAPEEREVIKKPKSNNNSRIYTENITIYTQRSQKMSRKIEEEKGPSKPNIYGKYEMFTSFFSDSYFDKLLVPSQNNGLAKVQPKRNRPRTQRYPNIMKANRILGEPHSFELSEVLADRNRPVVYATIGGKKLTDEEFSYRLPLPEHSQHTLPQQQQRPIERRVEQNFESLQRQRVPEYVENPAKRYLNSEYQPSVDESRITRNNYTDPKGVANHRPMEQISLPEGFISKAIDHTNPPRYMELQYPYDRMAQSMNHDEDDEANIEPVEDEESLPQITHQSDNGQLVDFHEKGNSTAYSFGVVKNNTVSQDGDNFSLKKGDYVVITRVYERRRLVECLWQGLLGLFSLDDFNLVANSKAVQDEQQNILIFNETGKVKSPVEESPTKTAKRNRIFENNTQNVQINLLNNEDPLYSTPTRRFIDDQAQPRTIYPENAKSPVTMLKRELRDTSFSGSDNSKADTKAPSNNTTPKEYRSFYNNY